MDKINIETNRKYLLTPRNLQVALGFVGNYALCGLSPQMYDMPVIQKKTCKR